MPYANNEGIRIYYEVEGEGPPLVLVYGIMVSVDLWRHCGFVELLRNDYRLILIDSRGHGASDKPHNPEAYALPLLAADVVAVLDDLGISKAHYLGYSLGGYIGYGIAKYAPERLHSVIVGDATLPWKRDPERAAQSLDDPFKFKEGMETHLALVEAYWGPRWTPEIQAMSQSNDLHALTAMLLAEEGILSHGFEDVAPALTMPCLFYVSEDGDDPAWRQCIEELPNGIYVSFPELDHREAGCRADLVVPHVRKFLAGVGED